MVSNKNIFYASNPARILDALWSIMVMPGAELARTLIFLPSRRAVRCVEQMIVRRAGHAVILPRLVALGEGDDDGADTSDVGTVSNLARVVMLARLLSADACVCTISGALPIARDLVRMTDYLENEGINIADVDWDALVDERYAAHFRRKSDLLKILSGFIGGTGTSTATARRNADIRAWRETLHQYDRVIVCGSTASVPATADLMAAIADLSHGYIILPGKIAGGAVSDFELNTNPYNSEYKFLSRIGVAPDAVREIDVGPSAIDFLNAAFSNAGGVAPNAPDCHLVECPRESVEACVAAEIAARAVADNKTVLIITPDAAGNQRLAAALKARGITADFSGGLSGAATVAGRAILNMLDDWIERGDTVAFDRAYAAAGGNLFVMLDRMIDAGAVEFAPAFDVDDDAYRAIWMALYELSEILRANKIDVTVYDARALIADTLAGVSIRPPMNTDAPVVVLGTIESRMQTADVVILTGLNDGMFPARGYENAWLPRSAAEKIGLPSGDRKVSLMALDFMNLSCGQCVYWLRSRTAGGTQTTESRFLSRVAVACGAPLTGDNDILRAVLGYDDVPYAPLDYSAPTPPADFSDVYVTELELLIHNPYAFYARHILRLKPREDYWNGADVRTFGNMVHAVIEEATDFSPDVLIAELDRRAAMEIGRDSVLYHFWHRRFTEMAPVIADAFAAYPGGMAEIAGAMRIGNRTVRARADRVWGGAVMDIKTGTTPTKNQLSDGTMPQLPLEALMLRSGGFSGVTDVAATPAILFLQLRNRDCCLIEYSGDAADIMINAARNRVEQLFNQYGHDGAAYEYFETGNAKYNAWDDLRRAND